MSNYRFKFPKFRAWNKPQKKMFHSHEKDVAFAVNDDGFVILALDKNGAIYPEPEGDDTDSVLMNCSDYKDKNNNFIFEGDVVFMRRPTKKGLFPIIGIVQARDFTFSVHQGQMHYSFDYVDKDMEILGNIFEHTDEELAKKGEELLKKYELKV